MARSQPTKAGKSDRKQVRRRAGRPAGAGPDLREQLLDAATACFARNGIAATSLRAIADEAGVNPALLHYYFGDKAQLQDAMVEERVMPAFGALRDALQAQGDEIAGVVAAFVRGIGEVIAGHPWLPALWVREVLCEGGALRSLLLERLAPQLPQLLAARFAAAQRAGRLNPDLDPRLLVVSLVGLTLFPAAGAPIWRQMFDAGDLDAGAMRDHTIALLDRGVGVG